LPGSAVHVLKEKHGNLYAPWNAALLLGAGLGAVVGVGLTRPNMPISVYGPAIVISLFGAFLLMIRYSFVERLAVSAAVAVTLVGITLPAVHDALVIIVTIPWVTIAFSYAFFRESSYQEVMDFGANLASGLRAAAFTLPLLALRLVVGRQTWQSTGFGRRT